MNKEALLDLLENLRSYAAARKPNSQPLIEVEERRVDGVMERYSKRGGDPGPVVQARRANALTFGRPHTEDHYRSSFHRVLYPHHKDYTHDFRFSQGRGPSTPVTGDTLAFLQHMNRVQEIGWRPAKLRNHYEGDGGQGGQHVGEMNYFRNATILRSENDELIEMLRGVDHPELQSALDQNVALRPPIGRDNDREGYAAFSGEIGTHAALMHLVQHHGVPGSEDHAPDFDRIQMQIGTTVGAPGMTNTGIHLPEGYLGMVTNTDPDSPADKRKGGGIYASTSVGMHPAEGHLLLGKPEPITTFGMSHGAGLSFRRGNNTAFTLKTEVKSQP